MGAGPEPPFPSTLVRGPAASGFVRGEGRQRDCGGDRPLLGRFAEMVVRAQQADLRRGQADRCATCRINGIPFDATGEKIRREGLWCVYQFGQQLDAMMAWDRFKGRWLLGEEFSYTERPENMPLCAHRGFELAPVDNQPSNIREQFSCSLCFVKIEGVSRRARAIDCFL